LKKEISILGCGWLGLALAKSLIKTGFKVKGSTTSQNKIDELKKVGIEPYIVDISKGIERANTFLASEVILIAITSKSKTDFERLITRLESSLIKKVLFVSSTSVYPNSNNVVTEDSEIMNTKLYCIEELFRKNQHFETTIIRFGGLFGAERIPGKFHKSGKLISNPEGFVNLIHRDDCIGIIKKVLIQNSWNETYNACCDSHPKRRDFYVQQRTKLGVKDTLFDEESTNNFKIVSSQKVIEKLNYTFIHSDL
jgi:nucleoside-diphosphate-sugar epimerase